MTSRPLTQDEADALRLIVTKSPAAFQEAAKTLAARNVLPLRLSVVAEMALRDGEAEWTAQERAQIAALLQPESDAGEPRTLDVRVRVNEAEKASIQSAAAAAGQTVSDYIRDRIGL